MALILQCENDNEIIEMMTTTYPFVPQTAKAENFYSDRLRKVIHLGDIIYASASKAGCKIAEIVIDKADCMADVTSRLRNAAGQAQGLVKIYVRNVSRGWSTERLLMLYSTHA